MIPFLTPEQLSQILKIIDISHDEVLSASFPMEENISSDQDFEKMIFTRSLSFCRSFIEYHLQKQIDLSTETGDNSQ